MKLFALAFSAVIGLAAAQLEVLSEMPQCALQCFTSAISSTDCALTDFYCQCSANAQVIQDNAIKCLCQSTCTTNDLAKVYSLSNELCSETLEAHGETYSAPAMMSGGVCTSSSDDTTTAATTTSNSTGSASPSGNSTSTASPSATAFEGAAANFGMSMAVVAAGGLAFFAM